MSTDIVHITENSANELQKVIDEKLDIPLSSEPDANTASVVMKHNLKVNLMTIQVWLSALNVGQDINGYLMYFRSRVVLKKLLRVMKVVSCNIHSSIILVL